MNERCRQCGTMNRGGVATPEGAMNTTRPFECESCGATGEMYHHRRAGLLGRSGDYFDDGDGGGD